MNKICAVQRCRSAFYPDDWSCSPKELVVITSDPTLTNTNSSLTGDPTDYPKLLETIVFNLAIKGRPNGLSVIAVGITPNCPERLKEIDGITYMMIDALNNGVISSFARDGLLFHTNGDSLAIPGKSENTDIKRFGPTGLPGYQANVFEGGQTLITTNTSGQPTVIIGSLGNSKSMSPIVNTTLKPTKDNPYGVHQFVVVPQCVFSTQTDQLKFMFMHSQVPLKFRDFYHKIDGFYYHLDLHAICLPGGVVVINDMTDVCKIIQTELSKDTTYQFVNHFLNGDEQDKNSVSKEAINRFYSTLADLYGPLDEKIEKALTKKGFKVVKAPLMVPIPLGQIAAAFSNGVPGCTPTGKKLFYMGKPDSNRYEEAIFTSFLKKALTLYDIQPVPIDGISLLTKKTMAGLRCVTAVKSAYFGFPP